MLSLVVALPSEAQPLLEYFALKPAESSPFRCYDNDEMQLVVSGIGVELCAAATGYAAGRRAEARTSPWFNLGICGHSHYAPGTLVIAGRVMATDRRYCWYPSLLLDHEFPVVTVISSPEPVTDYPEDACYDMEAAGFLTAATRISGHDACQVIKIVSDNHEHDIERLTRAMINQLVAARLADIEALVEQSRSLLRQPDPDAWLGMHQDLAREFHFTATQEIELRQLCRRLYVLKVTEEAIRMISSSAHDARSVLAACRLEVARLSPGFN